MLLWPSSVVDKLYPPDKVVVLLLLYPYRIITLRLQFHYHIHSRAANRIYQRTSFALLRERVRHNRREFDNTSRELLEKHLHLGSVLSKSDWSLIDQLTCKKATRVGEDSKARQLRKFARLHKTQNPTTKTSKETVINLSGHTLDDLSILVTTERS